MKALVHVMLKPEVLDPQGKAIQRAARSLGYERIQGIRQGKLFEIDLDTHEEEQARALVMELASKLLANPVIESFRLVSIQPDP